MPSFQAAASGEPDALLPYYPAVENLLGLSRSTATRMLARGEIATHRIGHRVLVKRGEIARVIAASQAASSISGAGVR